MRYAEYVTWLKEQYAQIEFESGVIEIGPRHNPTKLPGSPPWNMDWWIKFPDGKHAYLKERWVAMSSLSRGAAAGRRDSFSFHYGTLGNRVRPNGWPAREKAGHPAILRIDRDSKGPHIHFHGEEPHIMQDKVQGMRIEDTNPFAFVKAVLSYRKNQGQVDFDVIMGFSVVKLPINFIARIPCTSTKKAKTISTRVCRLPSILLLRAALILSSFSQALARGQ